MQAKWLILSALCIIISSTHLSNGQNCNLPQPAVVTVKNIRSCEATLKWSLVSGAAFYKVKFKKQGSTVWSQKTSTGLSTSYTFSGLDAASTYSFAVAAYCDSQNNSGFKTKNATTLTCEIPVVQAITFPASTTVDISWNGCPSSNNQIRYRRNNADQWRYKFTGNLQEAELTDLTANSTFMFQLSACPDTSGNWSQLDSFHVGTSARPNILLIILDDARFDSYSCNGGPSFFQTPNIDRIANEGVNFKNAFCVESFCIPSRGSIVTGLYPHKHGAVDNSSHIDPSLPTAATILDSAGYFTAWIGKYHMATVPQPGYDYWLASMVNTGTDEYNNLKYNCNGSVKRIYNHDTDILTDSTLSFLDRFGADSLFFLTLAYHAPHNPYIPQESFDGAYSGIAMPVPSDTSKFPVNYPSFLDQVGEENSISGSEVSGEYEKYFELLAGVDDGLGKIFQKLDDLNIMNNTCIIFTSDNGFILGEHGLFMKLLAYDASSRVPMFIRYPGHIADSTLITDQMALNVDIAPTILDLASIEGNYSFDGVSMLKLADHSATRTEMYYEFMKAQGISKVPYMRAVRTFNAKYIHYGCNSETNEFFDLDLDLHEDVNRIFDPAYADQIDSFKSKLDYYHDLFEDTEEPDIACSLQNPTFPDSQRRLPDDEEFPALSDGFMLYPNPASDQFIIAFSDNSSEKEMLIRITDMDGSVVQEQRTEVENGSNVISVTVSDKMVSGAYVVSLITGKTFHSSPLLVSK